MKTRSPISVRACTIPAAIALAGMLAFNGCEVGKDPTGESFFINPSSITLYQGTQSIRLEALGGKGPYRWSVSDASMGEIAPFATSGASSNGTGSAFIAGAVGNGMPGLGARVVTYVRGSDVGVNVITVEDQNMWTATAVITQTDSSDDGPLAIIPTQITLAAGTDTATFTVRGGSPPYTWLVEPSRLGYVSGFTDTQFTYNRMKGRPGSVRITIRDRAGAVAYARVTQEADPSSITVTANPSSLANDGDVAILTASGGTAPYFWSVFDVTRGDFVGESKGSSVVYRRNDAGTAVVRVTDSLGVVVDTMITQPITQP